MSYTKQNFQSGEVLLASQLNAMDEQISNNDTQIEELKQSQSQQIVELDSRLSESIVEISNETCIVETIQTEEEVTGELLEGQSLYVTSKGKASTQNATNRRTLKCAVVAGETYIVYCSYFNNLYAVGYTWVDRDNNAIEPYYDADVSIWQTKDFKVVAPDNAVSIWVHALSSVIPYVKHLSEKESFTFNAYTKNESDNRFATKEEISYLPILEESIIRTEGKVDTVSEFVIAEETKEELQDVFFSTVEGYPRVLNRKIVPTISNERKTLICDVATGEKYRVKCSYFKDASLQIGYAIADADGNVIEVYYNGSATGWNFNAILDVTIPENGAILYVHQLSNTITATIKKWVNETEYVSKIYSKAEIDEKLPKGLFSNLKYDNMVNLMSYRPLGELTQPYMCLTCDDGFTALTDTTIPMIKGYKTKYGKKIPVTFALWDASQIFKSGNESRKALVEEMLTASYNCSVAIHGANSYTDYSDDELVAFLDAQKEFLESNLIAPTSIIYPNHSYDTHTKAIAGSFYGVCGTGGVTANDPISYPNHVSGARSNMYSLYRCSLFGSSMTNETVKEYIDYAVDNNRLLIWFWHDVDMENADETRAQRCKDLLDYAVEYGVQKGIQFVNLGDVPNLK